MKCEFYNQSTGICNATGRRCHLSGATDSKQSGECSKQTVKDMLRQLKPAQIALLAKKIKRTFAATA